VSKSEGADLDAVKKTFDMLSPRQIADAWEKYKQIKPYYELVEKSLKDYAKHYGIELPNGNKVISTECSRTSMDTEKVTKLAKTLGASDADLDACYKKSYYTRVSEKKQSIKKDG
jgi:alanyl-tRNA synthetase